MQVYVEKAVLAASLDFMIYAIHQRFID